MAQVDCLTATFANFTSHNSDVYPGLFENRPSKFIFISISCLLSFCNVFIFIGIIWFERYGTDSYSTLMNRSFILLRNKCSSTIQYRRCSTVCIEQELQHSQIKLQRMPKLQPLQKLELQHSHKQKLQPSTMQKMQHSSQEQEFQHSQKVATHTEIVALFKTGVAGCGTHTYISCSPLRNWSCRLQHSHIQKLQHFEKLELQLSKKQELQNLET